MLKKELSTSNSAALNAALRLLTKREYSIFELQQKLSLRFSKEALDSAIERCVQEGWQSEKRTAQMIVRHMQFQGYGPKRLIFEFKKRRLQISLSDLDEEDQVNWQQVALEALKRKLGTKFEGQLSPPERQKLLSWLYRRGFTGDCCVKALEEYLN